MKLESSHEIRTWVRVNVVDDLKHFFYLARDLLRQPSQLHLPSPRVHGFAAAIMTDRGPYVMMQWGGGKSGLLAPRW